MYFLKFFMSNVGFRKAVLTIEQWNQLQNKFYIYSRRIEGNLRCSNKGAERFIADPGCFDADIGSRRIYGGDNDAANEKHPAHF